MKLDASTLRAAAWTVYHRGACHQNIADTPLKELTQHTSLSESTAYEWQLSSRGYADELEMMGDDLMLLAELAGSAVVRSFADQYAEYVTCQHGREPGVACVPCSWAARIVELEAENERLRAVDALRAAR